MMIPIHIHLLGVLSRCIIRLEINLETHRKNTLITNATIGIYLFTIGNNETAPYKSSDILIVNNPYFNMVGIIKGKELIMLIESSIFDKNCDWMTYGISVHFYGFADQMH